MRHTWLGLVLVGAVALCSVSAAAQTSAQRTYQSLRSRQQALDAAPATPAQLRALAVAWERFVRRYPVSGYADDALWAAATLSERAFARSDSAGDRSTAAKYYKWLGAEYPTSDKSRRARAKVAELSAAPPLPASRQGVLPPTRSPSAERAVSRPMATSVPAGQAQLRTIRRLVLPDLVRLTLELDDEIAFWHESIDGPPRIFLDLKRAGAVTALVDQELRFDDDVVKRVRVGRPASATTRVVLDLESKSRYSVFTLYAPFRIVVDVDRAPSTRRGPATSPLPVADVAPAVAAPAAAVERAVLTDEQPSLEPADPGSTDAPATRLPVAEGYLPPAAPPAPETPAANAAGGFSLARQLGLGVTRVVIDPGHGGHDPGALGKGITEAELVLDVALRVEKILARSGVEVVLTRRTNVFIPLSQRTKIANQASADLFLSIHANASRNAQAHGVETYFLNFATNSEAEAVAARENSASEQAMHTLPDIVRAIALNNKLDESRDFARLVQRGLVSRLRTANGSVRDLGVKQAPFVVLIGAGMPSVLAEIAFVTHPTEGQLLRTKAYRQHVADALADAVQRYMKSLKTAATVATRD